MHLWTREGSSMLQKMVYIWNRTHSRGEGIVILETGIMFSVTKLPRHSPPAI